MGWDQPEQEPTPPAKQESSTEMERRLFERMSFEFLREQRATRRWGIFFKLLAVLYISGFLLLSMSGKSGLGTVGSGKVTALVDLQGVIAHGNPASADTIVSGLRAAFEDSHTAGVILRINSPGGSPVQAGYINDEIYRLREEHPQIPLYAVVEDMAASGGYYVAAAADRIYADKGSLVGSIGVRMDGFGFVDSMHKLGVERRLFTAGVNKGFLDPFSELDPGQVEHVRSLLDEIHQQFIHTVEKKRRDKLAKDQQLFSGLVWTGERALQLGLVDELGSAGFVAREVIGAEKIVDFTPRDYSIEGLLKRSGVSLLSALVARGAMPW